MHRAYAQHWEHAPDAHHQGDAMSTQVQDPTATATLPRLLAGIPPEGALSLQDHLAIHGPPPALDGRRHGARLIEEIDRAGLRGKGGAGFPAAAKMRAVAAARGRPIVVINATEGEPASMKDQTLLQTLPHLVLDGGVLAAQALGADEVIVCVCEAGESMHSVERAISERRRGAGGREPKLHLAKAPFGYVTGQESALISFLNGGPALPTFTPPMPFEQGVQRRPTLVNNAETLSHLALIARYGADWFRQLGTSTQPGSTLISLSGGVAYPGVYEVEHGASLSSLIEAAGGLTTQVRAALVGGYAGTWIDGRLLHGVALSDEHLSPYGATLGAGVVALLSAEACPAAETARLMSWLADQTAGQCGPCVNGLHAIAETFVQVATGSARQGAGQNLVRLISLTRGRGACRHPDGAVRLVESALEVFAEELSDHARHGLCDACRHPAELPLPARGRPRRTERSERSRAERSS